MKKNLVYLFLVLFAGKMNTVFGRNIAVIGQVTSHAEKQDLPGVSILIKGTSRGAATNVEGDYALEAAPGSTLVFSFINLKTAELQVPADGKLNAGK